MGALRNEKGVALILVILMVSVIVAVTLELNASTRLEVYEAANFRDRIRTLYMAKSGFNAAGALLLKDAADVDSLNEIWAKTEVLSPYSAQLFEGEGMCSLLIEDESGKIPVHKLVNGSAYDQAYRDMLVRFLSLPEFELDQQTVNTIVTSMKDWIDLDDEATDKDGAESAYYKTLATPYLAKNDKLDTVDELLMVQGITPEIFFGTKERPGIRNFLTVYGEGRININTAPKLVLKALSVDMNQERADAMDEYRRNPANALSDPGWYRKIDILSGVNLGDTLLAVKSRIFRITSTGILSDIKENVSGVVERASDGKKMKVLYWKTGI